MIAPLQKTICYLAVILITICFTLYARSPVQIKGWTTIEQSIAAENLQGRFLQADFEMRPQQDYFSKHPQQVHASTKPFAASYTRKSGYYAVHYQQADLRRSEAILLLNEGVIAVFKGKPNQVGQDSTAVKAISPVYELGLNGPLAVPTGLVFVRFVEGVAVDSRSEAINHAGYKVVQNLFYAPQAAWLRACSGEIADALARIPRLEAIPDVENVEPQMLMESSRR